MRWAIVWMLAGCFSKPGLSDRDGGSDEDARGADAGDGGGADASIDSPLAGCSWIPLGTILDDASLDERHPWISGDGKVVTFWRGTGNGATANGLMFQAERVGIDSPFGPPIQIFPQTPAQSGAPNEGDPALDQSLLKMYVSTSSGILSAARAMPNGQFQSPSPDSDLVLVGDTRDVQEGGFVTDDGRTFLFVAGDSAGNTYDSEDLYIATRASATGVFAPVRAYEHNVSGKNECCPTMAGNVLMYERPDPIGNGKHQIVSSILVGGTFSPPELVVLPGSNSFQQPSLTADGQRLVYVVNAGNEWHLEEAKLSCP